ncbi:unnamed protein product [Notodromas monacha]|uniref:AIG1-type G domain-containing protein n=1 Tax=Notodromas monacha TaxID=399045 RepID=A0A7R9BF44_9CRUS|nr:unnamed protein product [Notodromas monacha]CAG0913508.1 unnamed protein product [Notodromas monacha]
MQRNDNTTPRKNEVPDGISTGAALCFERCATGAVRVPRESMLVLCALAEESSVDEAAALSTDAGDSNGASPLDLYAEEGHSVDKRHGKKGGGHRNRGYGHGGYGKVHTHYVHVPKYIPVVKYRTQYVHVPVYRTVVKPIYKPVVKPVYITRTKKMACHDLPASRYRTLMTLLFGSAMDQPMVHNRLQACSTKFQFENVLCLPSTRLAFQFERSVRKTDRNYCTRVSGRESEAFGRLRSALVQDIFEAHTSSKNPCTFSLGSFRKFVQLMEEESEQSIRRLCLIGVTGSGKSTLGNVLLGLDPDPGEDGGNLAAIFGFATGSDSDSVTTKVEILDGFWRGDSFRPIRVIDTPGHGDNKGRDEVHRQGFISGMATEREIDAFVWVKNAQQPRYDTLHQEFFAIFLAMFGPAFYRNLVVVFTHWGFSEKENRKRRGKTLEQAMSQLWASVCEGHGMHQLPVALSPIPMVAVDALHDSNDLTEAESFQLQLDKLWAIINNFSRLPVMDIQMVRDKRSELLLQLELMERAHEEERDQLMQEREALRAAVAVMEVSQATLENIAEHSRKIAEMEAEKQALTAKIKHLERISRAPWWLTLMMKIAELLASAGLDTLLNKKLANILNASKETQAKSFLGPLTVHLARALLKKYVDGKNEDTLAAAYSFFGIPREASESEIDARYDFLKRQFSENNELSSLDELNFALAKIKASLQCKDPLGEGCNSMG